MGIRTALRRAVHSLVLQSIEAFIALLCVMVGFPLLLAPERMSPQSVEALLPPILVIVWAAGLAVGGMVTLAAIVADNYRIERIGIAILWGTVTVHAIALTAVLPHGFFAMMTYIFFALTLMARYWVVGRLIKISAALASMRNRISDLETLTREAREPR